MTRLLVIITAAASLAACASSGVVHTPRPFPGAPVVEGGPPSPAGPAAPVAPGAPAAAGAPVAPVAPADGYALSGTALSLRGAPYRLGGVDPATGFDCSGFVRYVYQQHGVPMPREVREQFRVGKTVDRSKLEPGDLVFFSTVAPGASHVGIMIGGDQFVHAPSERGVVRVENLTSEYWASRYVGAKRVN
ncbi:MAG TPA: C40 family peptidase [Vicinamibacterales bacterium]|nr:C40 family peptidase [Vicinamibacterales bacterium]